MLKKQDQYPLTHHQPPVQKSPLDQNHHAESYPRMMFDYAKRTNKLLCSTFSSLILITHLPPTSRPSSSSSSSSFFRPNSCSDLGLRVSPNQHGEFCKGKINQHGGEFRSGSEVPIYEVERGRFQADQGEWCDQDAKERANSIVHGYNGCCLAVHGLFRSLCELVLILRPIRHWVPVWPVCGIRLPVAQFASNSHAPAFAVVYGLQNVHIAQMSNLDAHKLRVVLPAEESFAGLMRISDFEKVEWLNKTMKKLWPYINQAAGELIKGEVQPILDKHAMGVIQRLVLQTVAFGSNAPHITGVRVIPGDIDECVLEIQILWRTENEKVILMIELPGPDHEVKVKNLHLQGTAKLVFKPLTETLPGFGAVLLSLNEPPDFKFDMKFLGANIRYLPGVEKMIDNSIRTALMDSMVWPSRIVVPMIPGADFSFLELHPVGELEVQLLEAKDIYWNHIVKADLFVKIFVHQTQNKTKHSKTKRNTLKPVWNETFMLQVEYPETQKLSLLLMHDGDCEVIGSVELAITEFQSGVKMDRWCDIFKDSQPQGSDQICKKLQTGKLHICITYHPYSREKILAMRGGNETEQKIHEEHQNLQSQCHLKSNENPRLRA